jgi:hypothetical protein
MLIPTEDFVAGLALDIELSAQHRHLLSLHQPSHKTHPQGTCVDEYPAILGRGQRPRARLHECRQQQGIVYEKVAGPAIAAHQRGPPTVKEDVENLAIVGKTDRHDMGSILCIQRCKARNPGCFQFRLDSVRNWLQFARHLRTSNRTVSRPVCATRLGLQDVHSPVAFKSDWRIPDNVRHRRTNTSARVGG